MSGEGAQEMPTLVQVRIAIERQGYLRLPDPPEEFRSAHDTATFDQLFSKKDIWYRWKASTDDAAHLIYLGYKKDSDGYSISLTAYNHRAALLVGSALVPISSYLQYGDTEYICALLFRCWWLFRPAVRYANLHWFPNRKSPGAWEQQLDLLVEEVLAPNFFGITSSQEVMNILLRNDGIFNWKLGNPILRAAEIVALSKVMEIDRDVVLRRLDEFVEPITANLRRGTTYAAMMDEFFSVI